VGFCEFHCVVERGLHRGLFGWDLSSPRDGDAGEGLRNEEAIPGAQLPGSFGMDIEGADRASDKFGQLDDSGFGDLSRASGTVDGDGAVVAVEVGALQVAEADSSVAGA